MQNARGVHDFQKNTRPFDETAWHELGHALDYAAFKHITTSRELDVAFREGLPRVSEYERKRWQYFSIPAIVHGLSFSRRSAVENRSLARESMSCAPPKCIAPLFRLP